MDGEFDVDCCCPASSNTGTVSPAADEEAAAASDGSLGEFLGEREMPNRREPGDRGGVDSFANPGECGGVELSLFNRLSLFSFVCFGDTALSVTSNPS